MLEFTVCARPQVEKQTSGRKAAERAAKEAETRLSGVLSAKDSMDGTSRQRLEVRRLKRACAGAGHSDDAPGLHVKASACSYSSSAHTDTLCQRRKHNSLSMSNSSSGLLVTLQYTQHVSRPEHDGVAFDLIANTKPPGVAAGQQDAEALAAGAVRGREEAEAEVERLKDVAAAVQAKVQATADIVARMSGDLERAEVRGCMPPGPSPAAPSSLCCCCCWPVQNKLQAGARLVTGGHGRLTAVASFH